MTGWGNFESIHTRVISSLPDGATIVELGVAFGQGLATMVNVAKKLNKKIKIVGIDTFKGTPGEDFDLYYGKNFSYKNTVDQLTEFGIPPDAYEILIGDTVSASSLDMFKQVHYVFLDADHSYEGVLRDINAWWPRIVRGGYIGGHDWQFPTVSKAVKNVFKNPQVVNSDCWLQKKD